MFIFIVIYLSNMFSWFVFKSLTFNVLNFTFEVTHPRYRLNSFVFFLSRLKVYHVIFNRSDSSPFLLQTSFYLSGTPRTLYGSSHSYKRNILRVLSYFSFPRLFVLLLWILQVFRLPSILICVGSLI